MDGTSGLSASDIALLGNEGGMNGMSGFFWVFALLILAGGGFGFGNRAGEFGQYATAASQNEILLGQKFEGLSRQINQVGDGISSATFALNNSINGVGGQIATEGRAIQSQLAECCCSNKEATAQVRYDMANFASAINANIDNKFAAMEKNQLQAQIAEQAQMINNLNLQAMMAGVVRYPMASTYAMNNNPFCNCNCCG